MSLFDFTVDLLDLPFGFLTVGLSVGLCIVLSVALYVHLPVDLSVSLYRSVATVNID